MADPSNLPSAAQLASEAKRTHDTQYGATRPPLPAGIEEQAEYFFQRGELGTVYLRTFIDPHAFAGHPNAGHTAVANLLLVRAIQIAASTNVAVVVSYTVSSAVLIFSALARAGGTIPDIDPRGALWFPRSAYATVWLSWRCMLPSNMGRLRSSPRSSPATLW
jgi:hypothetical protein